MRERITYLLRDSASFSIDQFRLESSSSSSSVGDVARIRGLDAGKEIQLQLGLDELALFSADPFAQTLLDPTTKELRARWVSAVRPVTKQEAADGRVAAWKGTPLSGGATPGLHVFYRGGSNSDSKSPSTAESERSENAATPCLGLQNAFDRSLRCVSVEESFITVPSSSSSSTPPTWQYYGILPSIDHFVGYLSEVICSTRKPSHEYCSAQMSRLRTASKIDFDYVAARAAPAEAEDTTETKPATVTITAQWDAHAAAQGQDGASTSSLWKEDIRLQHIHPTDRVEIGVLGFFS